MKRLSIGLASISASWLAAGAIIRSGPLLWGGVILGITATLHSSIEVKT